MPLAGGGLAAALREHRHARRLPPGIRPGSVEVADLLPADGAQLEAVADLLRREHLDGGTPGGTDGGARAVGRALGAVRRRVLGAAGVPVEVAGDELPLAREAAVGSAAAGAASRRVGGAP